ncbi:cyclic-di-GMP phosphodiesterase TipF (flagellum assembly factor) [Rhizomicrobium palustre]|uniref:Cyclic-di-GMP phosphodiesterase TipF (Flagellum assembly factor) n=1 Tax=Rhizomicrobium palustre TaxID=189966 RepID=A0A846N0H2_9PROT|nr:EAL domain-containing protein [Rhizomicrobium palustre]NIK89063.1 cyclic-di-GMP phosphodiesterase TipF (flagellum assembly factor) [Rhizomicrobium palustre]
MVRILLLIIYALASATLGCLAGMVQGLSTGITAGAIVFLFMTQIHGAISRRREVKAHKKDIVGLKRASAAFAKAISETQARVDDVTKTMEARTSAQNKKIVSELQVLESLMKEFTHRISEKAKHEAGGRRAGPQADLAHVGEPEMLEMIRASLEENRVDLYLQPTVSLPQRKVRFYEALSRLRAENGSVIMPAQYIKIAAPAGLMSVVDNLLLFRCVQIVRRMMTRNRSIGVFCNISGDTLRDAEFFPQFLDYMQHNRDLGGQMVFEFSQEAVLKAGREGEANLKRLNSLGFALSMDNIKTLALDFGKLRQMGFSYIKVRADMLTKGMGAAGAAVAAEDFKNLLARHGLDLIAERVEDEKTVLQLLDYAVDFAQGYLFGEPRAVRGEMISAAEKPAASVIPLRKSA